ncbi:hypothetical protein CVT25_008102 [Psilocybe cyanescens]|uniref:Uncharacterized protein n=1 Tax=Psilocybe cyanescens TaxID=93625 RepID=A0A409X6R2_PSICY|nr:hypothetical protein CVT25_008102 [Psilocybe cyanescens]
MWTANKYLKNPIGDGGQPRIPTLEVIDPFTDKKSEVAANEEKAQLFASNFFPRKPIQSNTPTNFEYPTPLPDVGPITKKQIERQVKRLSPHKAYGPDEIPSLPRRMEAIYHGCALQTQQTQLQDCQSLPPNCTPKHHPKDSDSNNCRKHQPSGGKAQPPSKHTLRRTPRLNNN